MSIYDQANPSNWLTMMDVEQAGQKRDMNALTIAGMKEENETRKLQNRLNYMAYEDMLKQRGFSEAQAQQIANLQTAATTGSSAGISPLAVPETLPDMKNALAGMNLGPQATQGPPQPSPFDAPQQPVNAIGNSLASVAPDMAGPQFSQGPAQPNPFTNALAAGPPAGDVGTNPTGTSPAGPQGDQAAAATDYKFDKGPIDLVQAISNWQPDAEMLRKYPQQSLAFIEKRKKDMIDGITRFGDVMSKLPTLDARKAAWPMLVQAFPQIAHSRPEDFTVKPGIISVKGADGKIYNIYRGQSGKEIQLKNPTAGGTSVGALMIRAQAGDPEAQAALKGLKEFNLSMADEKNKIETGEESAFKNWAPEDKEMRFVRQLAGEKFGGASFRNVKNANEFDKEYTQWVRKTFGPAGEASVAARTFVAQGKTLDKITASNVMLDSFVRNMGGQVKIIKSKLKDLWRTDARLFNLPIKEALLAIKGDANEANLSQLLTDLSNEASKVAGGAQASIQAPTDSARIAWEKIHDRALPIKDLTSVVDMTDRLGKLRLDENTATARDLQEAMTRTLSGGKKYLMESGPNQGKREKGDDGIKNNPMNITHGKATQKWVDSGAATVGRKATDSDAHFLDFTTEEDGLKAGKELLTGPNYSGLTLDAGMKKWSNGQYGAEKVAPSLGGKKIGQLSQAELDTVVKGIIKAEKKNKPSGSQAGSSPVWKQNAQGVWVQG